MPKKDEVWCRGCGIAMPISEAHIEGNYFFCDLCFANHAKATLLDELSVEETEILAKVLEEFENQTILETGVGKISGGFAIATMFDYDDEYLAIELKWGVQSDCENREYIEQWNLERIMLDKTIPIKEIVGAIEES